MTRTTEFRLPLYEAEVAGEGTKQVDVTIIYRLVGSQDVVGALLRGKKGSLTVAENGTLIVVMKKIGGKWYWNPFGW